jgi:hypothetical protein
MIDISQENLLSLREVPHQIPCRPNGKRIHISVIYRWIQRGVQGCLLESTKIGGTTYTSMEAIQRFANRLSESRPSLSSFPPSTLVARQKQIEGTAREVEAILGGRQSKKHSK